MMPQHVSIDEIRVQADREKLHGSLSGRSRELGFTLIEIMIVLAILGGLMAFLGRTVVGQLDKSKVRQTELTMGELGRKLEQYSADCNGYPTTDQGLKALMTNPGNDVCPNWTPYIKNKEDIKDSWTRDIIYESDGAAYKMMSQGKDGKPGGEDYSKDIVRDSN